jgi:putative ABC transport system permease protein
MHGPLPSPLHKPGLGLAWRFAKRELRGGLRGFIVFIACIAIGVGAIAGVNSLARSLTEGLQSQGRTILGGDLSLEIIQQRATAEQRSFFESIGTVSEIAETRGMARSEDEQNQVLVEIKGVDTPYPLLGKVELANDGDAKSLMQKENGRYGVLAEAGLAARLDIQVGDPVRLGNATYTLKGLIASEPDKLSGGIGFGPRLMLTQEALSESGIIGPGSLVEWEYRILMPDAPSDTDVARQTDELQTRYADEGWRIDTRNDASPRLSSQIERFAQFLTLVGLTALIVGGVGVANAVNAFVERKKPVIATLKCLGAPGSFVVQVQAMQIMVLALIGIAFGIALGAATPWLAGTALQNIVPIPLEKGVYPDALALGVAYGLITAIAFAIWPLGKTEDVPATALFRTGLETARRPRPLYLGLTALSITILAGLAFFISESQMVAGIYIVATAITFVMLRLVGTAIMAITKRLPRPKRTTFRLAVSNIHRPGALTPSVVLSLGLGLTLLVAIAMIDGNLRRQLTSTIPEQAPSFFFLDIQNTQVAEFETLIADIAPEAQIQKVPMLRGRVTALKGIPADQIEAGPESAWVLRGDRGITYEATAPDPEEITEGEWWPENYDGEPLVSFIEEEGKDLGLAIGDTVSVSVLGREFTARIANFRDVEWRSLAINFVMVFSPNTFAGAPHATLATLTWENGVTPEKELMILRKVTTAFPSITSVRVKDALDSVNSIVEQIAFAVRGASSVTLIASILVLAGALAAGQRYRAYDAVILKTLGATRTRLLSAFLIEYALLGLIAAIFGLIAGSFAAWYVVTEVMRSNFMLLPDVALSATAIALILTISFGLLGTWRILGQKAAPILRDL